MACISVSLPVSIITTDTVNILGNVCSFQVSVAIFGMFGGPMVGLFIAGISIPIANTKGAFIGFVTGAGMASSGGLEVPKNNPKRLGPKTKRT